MNLAFYMQSIDRIVSARFNLTENVEEQFEIVDLKKLEHWILLPHNRNLRLVIKL